MPLMSPLLLFDLDNTLVDRNLAFQGWAERFLVDRSLPPEELAWFTTLDCGGYLDRQVLLSAATDRYGLPEPIDLLLEEYRDTVTELIECPPSHREALTAARAAGWTLGIVSNGATEQQLAKIERTGLLELVDSWTISEEAGYAKPDPRIFQLAAERCGIDPGSAWAKEAWMVGDHAPADIAGARVAGLRSVWIDHGRPWPETGYVPSLSAGTLPEAVALVLAERAVWVSGVAAPDRGPGRAFGRPTGVGTGGPPGEDDGGTAAPVYSFGVDRADGWAERSVDEPEPIPG